ncbi:MAG: tRNA pseudouridine(55) synthase TruB [Actinomycetota bacterium]|nr:tRNA pseudouridine(55) synthase TruB [Actinomycetota bacterium]
MNGILLIDKPKGITSHDLVAQVKKLLKAKKAGHTGTLDPDATGLMIILVGKATRLAKFFEGDSKTYLAEMTIGISTDTLDASGKVLSKSPPSITREDLEKTLSAFRGRITQKVPMFSAVKVNGKPLYSLARLGRDEPRPTREVEISLLKLISFEPGKYPKATLKVGSSKGTYIRSLVSDIGDALGVGAHLSSLVRLRSGRYSLEEAITMTKLEELARKASADDAVIPIEAAHLNMPKISVPSHVEKRVTAGNPVSDPSLNGVEPSQDILVLNEENRAVAVGSLIKDESGVNLLKPHIVLEELT